jgi:hypothetical protein
MYSLLDKTFLFILIFFLLSSASSGQETPNWDNQLYLGNKVSFGGGKWKYSGELQTRLENNFQSLDNWYLEFVSNYLASERVELVPDFRFTVKPDKIEYRPGLGFLYKIKKNNFQLVNQLKWQVDIDNHGKIGNAGREVVFFNYSSGRKFYYTLVAGFIYRWWPDWNGFQYIRVGPGFSYIFDDKHILNFSYFIGVENNTRDWMWAGIPMIQLIINLAEKEEYKYVPAYYFDF